MGDMTWLWFDDTWCVQFLFTSVRHVLSSRVNLEYQPNNQTLNFNYKPEKMCKRKTINPR